MAGFFNPKKDGNILARFVQREPSLIISYICFHLMLLSRFSHFHKNWRECVCVKFLICKNYIRHKAEMLLVYLHFVFVGACRCSVCVVQRAKLNYPQRCVFLAEKWCTTRREKRASRWELRQFKSRERERWMDYNWGRSWLFQHGRQVPHS